MRINLSNGGHTIVDAEDYDYLTQWKWNKNRTGYARRTASRSKNGITKCHDIFLHTEVIERKLGRKLEKPEVTDHISREPLNNTRENLRACSRSFNAMNTDKRKGFSSRFMGVYFCNLNQRWKATLGYKYKKINLGYFLKEKDAAQAYNDASIKYYGEIFNSIDEDIQEVMEYTELPIVEINKLGRTSKVTCPFCQLDLEVSTASFVGSGKRCVCKAVLKRMVAKKFTPIEAVGE